MNQEAVAGVACELCAGVAVTIVGERSRSGAALRTVACRGCGLVWSDPRPHDVRTFYTEDYRREYKGTFEPKPKHVLRAGHVALDRFERIRRWLVRPMRVLDVGSGGGEFAYLLKTLGHEVQGIEPNRGYAGYAAAQYGLDVKVGLVGDVELERQAYDCITIWHVLEHTEHPSVVLRQLARALRPDGVLVVEVPNIEATCQSPASTFHEAHLYHFNRATLVRMAERAGLALDEASVSGDGGNLTAIFRARPEGGAGAEVPGELPGNHGRVERIVREHQGAAHWASRHPYRRLAGRVARMAHEWAATRGRATGKARLDRLYAQALQPQAPRTGYPAWGYVAFAYVAAVMLEWALFDRSMLGGAWSNVETLGLYLGLQTAIVAGIVWLTRRPRGAGQYARLAAWSLPLFALPAYC